LRLSSATAGATAFENIPLSQIERIEIVPGPLSSVYGSDAIGGLIQIFTRRNAEALSAKFGGGSYRTGEMSAGFGRRINDTEFSISVGTLESNGFDATKSTIPFAQHNPDADGYRNTNFSGRLVQHFGDAHEVGFTAFQSEGATHFDAGLATDDVNRQTLSAFSAYSRNQLTSRWTSLLRVGTTRDKSVTVGAFPGYFQTDQHQVTWQNDFQLQSGTIVGGLEYLDERVGSASLFKQNSRTVSSAFASYSGVFRNHGIQASARHDDSSQFGGHDTGSVGYGYRFAPELRVRAAAGTAFKAPTFNDLYFPDQPPFFFSNPNVRPERSRSREIGADVSVAGQNFAITGFENNITDLITIVTDPMTFVSTTQNLNQARITGVEFAYHGELWGWHARAQATVQDPRDETTGFLLRRRAKQYGSVLVSRGFGSWNIGAELTGSSLRFDSTTEAANARMHGYGLLNLTAGYALSKQWSMNARWNNVMNREYELVQFFNTPRSNLFVWLAYQSR
jgi:vitamin B12 transporter